MKDPLIVRSVNDLQQFSSGGRTHSRIVLETDRLTPTEAAHWESKINRLALACGCELGAATCVAALIGCAWYVFTHGAMGTEHWVRTSLLSLGVVAASATGGKVVGLIYSRQKLRRAIADLTRFLGASRRTL
jgi:hypothetical protein